MRKLLTVCLALVLSACFSPLGSARPISAAPDAPSAENLGHSEQIGAFFIEVLPQYQLMEAIFSQSIWAEWLHLASNKNDYMADLNAFMAPYREHPAVRLMNDISRGFGASGFAGYAFHLGPLPDLEVIHDYSEEYYELIGGKEKMEEFRLAMKALAEESNFLDFVRRWQPHYGTWADQALKGTDLARVEDWLTGFFGTSPSEFHLVLSPILVNLAFGPSVADREKGLIPYQTLSCATGNPGEPVFAAGDGLEMLSLHELGHSFVNPALERYAESIDASPTLAPDVQENMIDEGNGSLVRNFVVENVLRAVTSRAEGEIFKGRMRTSRIGVHKSRGYYLTGLLARDLDEYADNRDKYPTFADFVPTLLDKIETYRTMEGVRLEAVGHGELADAIHSRTWSYPSNPDREGAVSLVCLKGRRGGGRMNLIETGPDRLAEYASVPISRTVSSIFRLEAVDHGLGGIRFVEQPVSTPYQVGFDSDNEERPLRWPQRFDVSNWGFFLVFDGDAEDSTASNPGGSLAQAHPIGAATVALDTPGVNILEGRRDLGVLWDLRVDPAWRGRGVGTMLVNHAKEWCRQRNCRQLKVETQNTNVPACRFYAQMGFTLGSIVKYAYASHPELRDEVMLLWYMDLQERTTRGGKPGQARPPGSATPPYLPTPPYRTPSSSPPPDDSPARPRHPA